jgi:hypothetical protein
MAQSDLLRIVDGVFQTGLAERATTLAITAQEELLHRLGQRVSALLRILGLKDTAL